MELELTFTRLNALRPRVIKIRVTRTSTLVVPSPTESAAAELAGCLKGTALETFVRGTSLGNTAAPRGGALLTRGLGDEGFFDVCSRWAHKLDGGRAGFWLGAAR